MNRRPGLVLVVLAGWVVLAGCADPAPIEAHDVRLTITADAREVAVGEAFTVTVLRIWRADLVADPFPDGLLAPLDVTLEETTRREDGRHVEETRRYRARIFDLGNVSVPAATFTARSRSGAAERVARGNRLDVSVRPALDPENPGPAELPGDLLSERFPWLPMMGAVAAILGALALVRRSRRRRRGAGVDESTPAGGETASEPTARDRALRRLDALGATRPATTADVLAFHVEAASLLRDYLVEEHAVGTRDRTTEEVLAAAREAARFEDFYAGVLGDLLRQCDLVKFACHLPSARRRESLLETGAVFVRETSGASGDEGGSS